MTVDRGEGHVFLPPLPEDQQGTFEAAAYEALRRGAAMTFWERLLWEEEAAKMAREAREQAPLAPPIPGNLTDH